MRRSFMIAASAALAFFSVAAHAQTATPGIDNREIRQQERIGQGVRSGELTAGETRNLERGQARIQRREARAKADGVVTPRERRHIARAQNHQSRKIYRMKHNARAY